MAVITSKMGVVTMKDGTGTPIDAILSPGPGDIQFGELEAGGVESIPVYNRGVYLESVDGDAKQITGQITVIHDGDITDASTNTPVDAALKTGSFSAGVTVDPGGTGASWMTDIVVVYTRNAVVHTWTFATCRVRISYAESKEGNKYTIAFTCLEGVTYTSA